MKAGVPTVTAVIPTRQRAQVLPAAIASVLGQSYPHLRVLVCDNASEDGTPAVVARMAAADPRIVYHRHATDVGATANFQWGLDAVDTELCVLLSDDDLILPRFFERAVTALAAHPEARMFCGASVVYDERDGSHALRPRRGWRDGAYPEGLHVADVLEHHFLWTGVVFDARVRGALGRFEPIPLVDVLYLAKVAARFPFVVSTAPCAVFRATGANAHLQVGPDELRRTHAAMREAVAELPLSPSAREAALAAVDGNVRGVALRALREALASERWERFDAMSRYLAAQGWLSGRRRLRAAVLRRVGPRSVLFRWSGHAARERGRGRGTPLSLEAVVARYTTAGDDRPGGAP